MAALNKMTEGGEAFKAVVERLEPVWAGEARKSISNMVKWLQKEGVLTMKAKKPKNSIAPLEKMESV